MTHYDLIIIGSGSGNSIITDDWDDKRVAIVDGGVFGGTCLNVGCIPTKMFVYPSELARTPSEAAPLGVSTSFEGADWPGIRDRIFGRIDEISESGRRYRDVELDNVTLYRENARFTAAKTLVTDSGEELTGEQIVIAAGSRPVLPAVPGIDLPAVHTSDTVMRLDSLPSKVLILGGGYIAAEFAAIFSGLGSEVVQVTRSHALLRGHDADISTAFTEQARAQWDVRFGRTLAAVQQGPDGGVRATLAPTASSPANTASAAADSAIAGGADETIHADVVLVAIGRVPNGDRLGLEQAGYDVATDGRLQADAAQRALADGAPVDGVWALGDVSSAHQLKHVANHEARVVTHNLVHPQDLRHSDHRFVPSAVFTHPQIATVGLSEAAAAIHAAEHGLELATVRQDYGSTAYGWAMEDGTGFVKLIAEKATGRLLGAHILGHQASLLIQPLIQAMSFGLPVQQMARGQYWIHPALMEVVENALLSLGLDDAQ